MFNRIISRTHLTLPFHFGCSCVFVWVCVHFFLFHFCCWFNCPFWKFTCIKYKLKLWIEMFHRNSFAKSYLSHEMYASTRTSEQSNTMLYMQSHSISWNQLFSYKIVNKVEIYLEFTWDVCKHTRSHLNSTNHMNVCLKWNGIWTELQTKLMLHIIESSLNLLWGLVRMHSQLN